MRKYLLAAVAAAAIATPAYARDGSPYVGIEAGLVFGANTELDVDYTDLGPDITTSYDNAFDIDFKTGVDLDLIAGYDFGMIRAELELAHKSVKADDVDISGEFADDFDFLLDDPDEIDIDGRFKVTSLMGNVLFDFGNEDSWSFYVGGGLGRAWARFDGERDSAFAWQLIAGTRYAVSENIDVGLKYRYFQTGNLNYDIYEDCCSSFEGDGKFSSHSLLASLIFNFNTPAPPPPPVYVAPPAPPPAATQTCYDGSVILATDICPSPPPPPPPAAPERG